MDKHSPHYESPQQQRSLETMTRILDATAALLEEKSFDELTINEIVGQAECSVGAFYGRFKDKDGLLHALDERYFRQFRERIDQFFAEFGHQPQSLEAFVRGTVQVVADIHQNQRGLMRTLILRARTSPDDRFRQREQMLLTIYPRYKTLMLAFSGEINHPDPEKAVGYGFYQMFTTIREKLLWGSAFPFSEIPDDEFLEEAARGFTLYLKN